MQARTLKIIAALLIISAIVMGVIGYKISQQDSARSNAPAAAPTSAANSQVSYAQKILVVNQNLAKGSTITAELLELVPFPIPVDDGFSRADDILNKRLEVAVRKGEVLRNAHFEKQSPLASQIREGYRAIAVDVDEVVGAGGFLVPGDHVDVIFTTRASKETYNKSLSRRVLSNIRLLAYGSDIGEALPPPPVEGKRGATTEDKSSGKRSRSAVLEVADKDINTLTLAANSGKLLLVAVGEAELATTQGDGEAESDPGAQISTEDEATFIRSVTGLKPPAPPKSVYVYSGDQVETVRVPK